MGFELERVLYATEDFLRRNIRSKTAREAQKRKAQRKLQEALRRMRRAFYLFVALLAGLVAWSIFVDPIGFLTWLVAIPTVFLVALVSLFWSTRREAAPPTAPAELPLDALAIRVEEGLIDRCPELPGHALPFADAIIARLHELQPHLARLDADDLTAGDARRLIGRHLPKLVDSYLELPERLREPGSEASRRFAESLGIVADELDHLLDRCCRDKAIGFETQRRFIESRYRDDERLSGE